MYPDHLVTWSPHLFFKLHQRLHAGSSLLETYQQVFQYLMMNKKIRSMKLGKENLQSLDNKRIT